MMEMLKVKSLCRCLLYDTSVLLRLLVVDREQVEVVVMVSRRWKVSSRSQVTTQSVSSRQRR